MFKLKQYKWHESKTRKWYYIALFFSVIPILTWVYIIAKFLVFVRILAQSYLTSENIIYIIIMNTIMILGIIMTLVLFTFSNLFKNIFINFMYEDRMKRIEDKLKIK